LRIQFRQNGRGGGGKEDLMIVLKNSEKNNWSSNLSEKHGLMTDTFKII
jgi:hypothetical protein